LLQRDLGQKERIVKTRFTVVLLFALACVWGCKKKPAPIVQEAPKAHFEADFASEPYLPVGNGFASFLVEQYDFNHNGTGAQGVLLEAQKNHMQSDDGQPSGYHYFLYSSKVHASDDGSMRCDLGKMLTDPGQHAYKAIMMSVTGEGFVSDSEIALENEDYNRSYPGKGCDFLLTGVHSQDTIPDDVWKRADAMWKEAEQKTLADRARAKEEANQAEKDASSPANDSAAVTEDNSHSQEPQ